MSAASRPGRGFETRSSNVACNPPASVSGNAIGSSDKRVGWRIATDPPTGKLPWVHVPVSAMRRTRFCSAWRHYISALAKTWDFKKLHVESVRPRAAHALVKALLPAQYHSDPERGLAVDPVQANRGRITAGRRSAMKTEIRSPIDAEGQWDGIKDVRAPVTGAIRRVACGHNFTS
jgi:hypothetical protein